MRNFFLSIFLLFSSLSANTLTCSDPLYELLQKKKNSLSSELSDHLNNYTLQQFQKIEKNWDSKIAQLCAINDCDCLVNEYQKYNLELSQQLKTMKVENATKIIKYTGEDTECGFHTTFPDNMVVYAAGDYRGMPSEYRIGEKGDNASIFRVIVNSPNKPVALILGSYDASIWDILWTDKTFIKAVYVMGHDEQAISGLPKTVPISISTINKKYDCGNFPIQEKELNRVNPLSNELFHKNTDKVYYSSGGYLILGEPLADDTLLITSQDTPINSLHNPNAPLQKEAGLYDAVAKGILREATSDDVREWISALKRDQNLPTEANPYTINKRFTITNGFVILKPFIIPEGLTGSHSATFFLQKGIPQPIGNLGHSILYDFNTMTCKGSLCQSNLSIY